MSFAAPVGSPESIEAWIAAPAATASSGLMDLFSFFKSKN
jgi:hypothetical protein